jgi:sec-independent protein translocase protein TatC
MSSTKYEYSDDLFADTRMSFGDHLEELRSRMWKAVKGLLLCLVLGFILDGIGSTMGWKWFGLGKPVLEMIKAPVEEQMDAFYDERAWKAIDELKPKPNSSEEKKEREKEKERFMELCKQMRDSSSGDLNKFRPLRVQVNRDDLRAALEKSDSDTAELTLNIPPIDLQILLRIAQERTGKRNQLTTLSAQEMFIVYFKVTLLAGFVLASPWIFFQFWAFVGAGLYPHEKRYVHVYLPFSVGLFIAGVLLCFIWVLPAAVKALLAFNEWLGVDPDIRLNEWLGLAIILPVVFGISFQTPLVMLFLSRLGMFTYQDYLSKWRIAMFVLACFAAVITPTPDAVTMLYLFVPMFGLYMLGILLCKWAPQPFSQEEQPENAEEVAV